MSSSKRKGSRNERELVNLLDSYGFVVVRTPTSGAGTERELPDLVCGKGDITVHYAMEAKSSSGKPIYIPKEEIAALLGFAQDFGARARVAVKFDVEHSDPHHGEGPAGAWRFIHPAGLYTTDEGNYRIKKHTAYDDEKTQGIEELLDPAF